ALLRERTAAAFACAAIVVGLKVTFAPLFLGLALVHRRFGLVLGVLAVWACLNGIGFARMGGMEAVRSYQQTMTALERPDQVNYPDPRAASSAARLDWPY